MLIHLKKNDHEFLYETTLNAPVEQVISELVNLLNALLRLKRLIAVVPDLAKHGPQRPPESQGLDECLPPEEIEKIKASCIPGEAEYCPDPAGIRSGRAPITPVRETMLRTVDEIQNEVLGKPAILAVPLTMARVEEAVNRLRGAVMIGFPQGLPEFDSVEIILSGNEDLASCIHAKEILDPATAMLWFSNRNLERGRPMKEFMRGCTERTKAVMKLTKAGSMAPAREPYMSSDQEKEMMAYWYRKQEEEKKMKAEAEELDETRAEWANPNRLRSQFIGMGGGGNISFR